MISGLVIGILSALVVSSGIDSSYGEHVTGPFCRLGLPNVIYALAIGFLVGFSTGLIIKKKGWLYGGIAQIMPYFPVLILRFIYGGDISNWYWSWIGLLPAIIGGYCSDQLYINDLMRIIKDIKWNWLWLWIPLFGLLYSISGSIHFLIAQIMLGWQILFHPSLWLIGFFAFSFISILLFLTFSVPSGSFVLLLYLVAAEEAYKEMTKFKRVGLIILIVLGVPPLLMLIWYIDSLILNFFVQRGIKIY